MARAERLPGKTPTNVSSAATLQRDVTRAVMVPDRKLATQSKGHRIADTATTDAPHTLRADRRGMAVTRWMER